MLCRAKEFLATDTWSPTLLGGFRLRPADGTIANLPGQTDCALIAIAVSGSHSSEGVAGLRIARRGGHQEPLGQITTEYT
jgi:hypothetical protein